MHITNLIYGVLYVQYVSMHVETDEVYPVMLLRGRRGMVFDDIMHTRNLRYVILYLSKHECRD